MKKLFFIAALFFSLPAAAGYFYSDGTCYPSAQAAYDHYMSRFPFVDNGYLIDYGEPATAPLCAHSVSSSGQVNMCFTKRDIITGATTVGTTPLQFVMVSCDATAGTFDQYPVQDVLFIVGLIAIWALGFKGGLAR